MAREKKPVHKVQMTEGKRNIIRQLLEEYDIESAQDMESIQQRIVENGKKGKATWLYIDEFHVLLNSEYSAKYLQQLWKKVRKQGGLCTGITQNVVDLLQNYTATTMLANSEFVALLKQANTDSFKMAEVIGVSDAQLRFVTNSQSGMGLLKCGNVVIPFDNQIERIRVFINCITPISMRKLKIKKVDDKTMVICKFRLIGRNIHCSLRSQ